MFQLAHPHVSHHWDGPDLIEIQDYSTEIDVKLLLLIKIRYIYSQKKTHQIIFLLVFFKDNTVGQKIQKRPYKKSHEMNQFHGIFI